MSDTLKVRFNLAGDCTGDDKEELSMRCRNRKDDVKTRFQTLIWDKSKGRSTFCLGGIRHRGSVTYTEACDWNMGTCHLNDKGKSKQQTCKGESTDVRYRDGSACSSVEASVMEVERRG